VRQSLKLRGGHRSRHPALPNGLEPRASKLVDGVACPRPTQHLAALVLQPPRVEGVLLRHRPALRQAYGCVDEGGLSFVTVKFVFSTRMIHMGEKGQG
jgi:hypothetical protein